MLVSCAGEYTWKSVHQISRAHYYIPKSYFLIRNTSSCFLPPDWKCRARFLWSTHLYMKTSAHFAVTFHIAYVYSSIHLWVSWMLWGCTQLCFKITLPQWAIYMRSGWRLAFHGGKKENVSCTFLVTVLHFLFISTVLSIIIITASYFIGLSKHTTVSSLVKHYVCLST